MMQDLVPIPSRQLTRSGLDRLPVVVARAGERAAWRFLEFFTANIRNKNTCAAYAQACSRFFDWCDERGLALEQLQPVIVASYIEGLQNSLSAPSVKQHLAAIRMLFDWLILGQVIPMNPAAAVRGPKHVVKKGKTPALKFEEARQLLDSIDTESIVGLRDRALLGLMCYFPASAPWSTCTSKIITRMASAGGSVCTKKAASATKSQPITTPRRTSTLSSTLPALGPQERSAIPHRGQAPAAP